MVEQHVGKDAPDGRSGVRRPTVVDVARLAQVSVGTVSNYLNRPGLLAVKTRRAVKDAIDLLGFVPNGQARALARGGTRTVGLVVTDLGNSYFVEMVRGAEQAAADAGYALLVASSVTSEVRQTEMLRVFDEARFDGVLIAPFEAASHYREPEGLMAPAVVLNVARPRALGSSVVSDDEHGGYIAATHLINQGRSALHFVGGPARLAPIAQRLHGVERAVREHPGTRLTIEHVPFADHVAEGSSVGRALLELPNERRPDAIISASDLIALAVIHTVQSEIAVPAALAVIGYDNNAAARDAAIPVSTVAQRGADMGRVAFELLLAELNGDGHEFRLVSLKPELVVRASSQARPT